MKDWCYYSISTSSCAAGIALMTLLAGCLPIPHTTERSEEVRGRVLDASNHLPIRGAEVCLDESPHHPTYTDGEGYFRLKATHNFHIAYVAPEGDWPNRKDGLIEISHTNYVPVFGNWSGDVGDILLKPKQ